MGAEDDVIAAAPASHDAGEPMDGLTSVNEDKDALIKESRVATGLSDSEESDDEDCDAIPKASRKAPSGLTDSEEETTPTAPISLNRDLFDADDNSDDEAERTRSVATEGVVGFTVIKEREETTTTKKKKKRVVNSDDDDDEAIDESSTLKYGAEPAAIDSDDSDSPQITLKSAAKKSVKQKARMTGSDSEEEERGSVSLTSAKKKKSKAEELNAIYSESQRLKREERMSLPYHRPEKMNVLDFLKMSIGGSQLLGTEEAAPVCVDFFSPKAKELVTEKLGKTQTKAVAAATLKSPATETDASELKERTEEITSDVKAEEKEAGANDTENGSCSAIENTDKVVDDADDSLPDIVVDGEKKLRDEVVNSLPTKTLVREENFGDISEKDPVEPSSDNAAESPNASQPILSLKSLENKKSRVLHPQLLETKPRLSAGAFGVVSLDEDDDNDSQSVGLELFERFVRHSRMEAVKKNRKHVVKMKVLRKAPTLTSEDSQQTSDKLKLQEMDVVVGEDDPDSFGADVHIPGAKHEKLKEKLRADMAAKRAEARRKREEEEAGAMEEEEQEEEEEQVEENPEAELTDQTDTDEEEFDEEEEFKRKKKKKKFGKSEMIDEEVEVSGEEEEDDEDEDEDEHEDEDGEVDSKSEKVETTPKRTRIRQMSNSDDDDDVDKYDTNFEKDKKSINEKVTSKPSMSSSPPRPKSVSDIFASFGSKSDLASDFGSQRLSDFGSQKRLFADDVVASSHQNRVDDDELAALCSGAFPSQKRVVEPKIAFDSGDAAPDGAVDDELAALCSGAFPSQPSGTQKSSGVDPSSSLKLSSSLEDEIGGERSGAFRYSEASTAQLKCSREDDDDELLGLCSGAFPSVTSADSAPSVDVVPKKVDADDELVDLCSGAFPSPSNNPTNSNSRSRFSLGRELESSKEFLLGGKSCSFDFSPSSTSPSRKEEFSPASFRGATQILDFRHAFGSQGDASPSFKRPFRKTEADSLDGGSLDLGSATFSDSHDSAKLFKLALPALDEAACDGLDDDDELMGLCSGSFAEKSVAPAVASEEPPAQAAPPAPRRIESSDEEGNPEGEKRRKLKKKRKRRKKAKTVESDGEEEEKEEDGVSEEDEKSRELDGAEEEDEEDDELKVFMKLSQQNQGLSKKLKKKIQAKIRRRYFENEAELSGSEAGSDENDDLKEEDDVMEAEAGDQDELPSDEELLHQIGGIHAKRLRDEDARQLKVIQDIVLEDGDLDADGAQGRLQNFRWKNIDTGEDDGDARGDDEDDDDEDPLVATAEAIEAQKKWRKMQFERELWLKEVKSKEGKENEATVDNLLDGSSSSRLLVDDDDDSQFIRLGSKILDESSKSTPMRQFSSPAAANNANSRQSLPSKSSVSSTENSQSQDAFLRAAASRCGSILSKNGASDFFSAKSSSAASRGASTARPSSGSNFAFKTLSPVKRPLEAEEKKRKCDEAEGQKVAKRPKGPPKKTESKAEKPKQKSNSIFSLLNC